MLKTSVWAWVVLLAAIGGKDSVPTVDANGGSGMQTDMMPTAMSTMCMPVDGGWSVTIAWFRFGFGRWGVTGCFFRRVCNNPTPQCGGAPCWGRPTWFLFLIIRCPNVVVIIFIYGDPHLKTIDGKDYTFNGLGEYTLVNAVDGEFLVQGRTRKAIGSDGLETDATVLSAVAAKTSTSSFVQVNQEEGEFRLYVDDTFTPEFNDLAADQFLVFVDVMISKGTNGSVVAEFTSGARLEIFEKSGVPSAMVHLPEDYMGQTKGLMGVWNGDVNDDFTRPDGTILSPNATDEEIYAWGQLWEVTEAESICYYGDQTYADFHNQDPSYRPIFETTFDDPDFEQEALGVCGDDRECLFDASVTGNVTIGKATMEAKEQSIRISEELVNSPPIIEGPISLEITVGEVETFSFSATDLKGDPVTIVAETLPPGATFVSAGNTATVTWNVVDYAGPAMSFTATNSRGQTTLYIPQVNLCKCQNTGVCDFGTLADGEDEDGDLRVVACHCSPYHTGQFCEDFDECAAGTDDCGQNAVCVNDFGGYHCECKPGYYPNPDGKSCRECPYGYRAHKDNCYRFWGGKNAKTYSGARQVCQKNGGDIYMWKSAAAVARLKRKLISDGAPSVWIGLSDEDLEGTWIWANGMVLGGSDFTDWSPDPPRNTDKKDCAVARKVHRYRWKAVPCSYRRAFICRSPRAP
ncbi:mucin-like protein isoform X1 [Branchiostoma lanceolatum]|uniref:mucin-like protein isoform X1 n=1 Tax=Branchiostoma lanceolatum TaxID=7740 RepID=UPI00345362CF